MSFRCAVEALERLEWPRMCEWLSSEARSLRGAEACRALEFEQTLGGVQDRLAETGEACALLEDES